MKAETLENIYRIAISLKQASHCGTTRTNKHNFKLAPLELPSPIEMVAEYDVRDIPPACMEQCIARLEHLRNVVCQQYETICLRFASTFSDAGDDLTHLVAKSRHTYVTTYHKETKALIERVVTLVQKRKIERSTASGAKSRPAFKHEFTPLLEHYFELNPYPSTSDRTRLAEKCTMSVRQIEVWFQNHRNRARKEGRPLCRASASSVVNDFFENIIPQLHGDSVSSDNEDSGYGTQLSDDECQSQLSIPTHHYQDNEVNLLESSVVPSYAFPTRYSESDKPSGPSNFSSLSWLRKSSPSVQVGEPVDVDDLAQLFAKKLHIRDSRPYRKHHDCQSRANEEYWLLSMASVAPKAPHPALVRSTRLTKSRCVRRATTASRQILFESARQSSGRFHSLNLPSRHISVP